MATIVEPEKYAFRLSTNSPRCPRQCAAAACGISRCRAAATYRCTSTAYCTATCRAGRAYLHAHAAVDRHKAHCPLGVATGGLQPARRVVGPPRRRARLGAPAAGWGPARGVRSHCTCGGTVLTETAGDTRSVSRHRSAAGNAPFPRRAARSSCRTFGPYAPPRARGRLKGVATIGWEKR